MALFRRCDWPEEPVTKMKAPGKWKQVEELFNAALELEPAARAPFLSEACAGDEELRREVESLLAYEEKTADFIQKPALEVAAGALAADARETDQPKTVSQQIGAYRIIEPLGRGGMGAVYLALDSRLGRRVAIKLLPAEYTADADRVRRFEQEARAASALNHPNIITIHEIGQASTQEGGTRYIVQEFVEGETLRRRLDGGRMKMTEALDVAIQIAAALSAAHEAGIIHRDIKPENVMLRHDGYVKVLDFGLAKLTEKSGGARERESGVQSEDTKSSPTLPLFRSLAPPFHVSTSPGVVMGTASYMSPEQARGLKVNARTDIFSLGVVLYEMITACRPFEGATMMDVVAAILDREPAPITQHASDAPVELQRIVSFALRKGLEERYRTSGELLVDLRNLKQELELESRLKGAGQPRISDETKVSTTGGEKNVAARASPALSLLKRYWTAAALVLAIALAVSAVYFYQHRKASIESVAVLPFKFLGADKEDEYLALGMTDALITRLADLKQLTVRPTSAVLKFQKEGQDAIAAGRALRVDAVLDGYVQKFGETINIRTQLIRVSDGALLWSGESVRPLANLPLLHDSVMTQVAEALALKLTDEQRQKLKRRYRDDAEAYQAYLKGRYFWNRRGAGWHKNAIEAFDRATAIDPNYAMAYAGLADTYIILGDHGLVPPKEVFPKAREAAVKALELDDSLVEAHTAFAMVKSRFDWDAETAEREFKRAIELNPGYALARGWYAMHLMSRRRFDEARAEIERAQKLEPLLLSLYAYGAGIYVTAGQPDQAIAQCRKALDLDPDFMTAHNFLGRAYVAKGMYEEAIAEFETVARISSDNPALRSILGYALAASGRRQEAIRILDELKELSARQYLKPYLIARIHVGLGDHEQALEWLDKALEDRDPFMVDLSADPWLDPLRSNPKFRELMRRVGLPVEQYEER